MQKKNQDIILCDTHPARILCCRSDSIRMFVLFISLCLILMSDDANSDISETLHVSQNIGTVLQQFSTDERPLIRRIEGLSKKQNNAKYAVIFTETCLKENLLPKFTNI